MRPTWGTTLKLWGWTQEQNFHGIGVPGGRFFFFFFSFIFQKLGCVSAPKHCWEGFAVCGVIFFSLLFCIYIEVVRSTLLKIPLSLPFGESEPFNESAWFRVANWRFYQRKARKMTKSRTYPLIILYSSVTMRPKWGTILKLWSWTQEQDFHGIGVPGGRFFNFQNLGCVSAPSIAGKLSRCAE